jgi:nucleoside-diphosphate-sugar epimerase
MKAVRLGVPLPLGRTSGKRSLAYVRNVADAIRTSLTHPRAPGEIFHVADDVPLTTRELILKLAQLQRVRARLVPVPTALLSLAGRVLRRTDEVDRLIRPLTVSSAKIRERLDWRPRFPADYGLQEMVEAFGAASLQDGTSADPRTQCQATAIPGARTTGIQPSYETAVPLRERPESCELIGCAQVRSE